MKLAFEDKRPLFDPHGRRIPPEGLQAGVNKETRRRYVLVQPEIDYSQIHARVTEHLRIGDAVSADEFEERCENILVGLRGDERTKDVVNGVHIPFFCRPTTGPGDLGRDLEEIYLEAVRRSFKARFPQYDFTNHRKGKLAGQVRVAAGSRQEKLAAATKRHGTVFGWYFPDCLSEYSVPAQREQISGLPDQFLLSGGFDASAALVGSPDLLQRKDGYPPLLGLPGLQGSSDEFFYFFEAYGYDLTFNRRTDLRQVSEYWAGGLTVLGC